jgi:hypothetical protein
VSHEYFSAEDTIRELRKVSEAVATAIQYHVRKNEANAALHCSPTVLHSPLTVKLQAASLILDRLIGDDEDA